MGSHPSRACKTPEEWYGCWSSISPTTCRPRTRPPPTKVFHLYQYGYTFFKNRWYLEGTARWAGSGSATGSDKPGAWPQSSAEIHELFRQAYETASFWRRLVAQVDPGERTFIKAFLEELDRTDDTLRTDGKWPEAANRQGSANDLHIWGALRSTLSRPEFPDGNGRTRTFVT